MRKLQLLSVSLLVYFLTISCENASAEKQNLEQSTTEVKATIEQNQQIAWEAGTLEVIQFHSQNRCKTCNAIEKLSLEVLQEFEEVPFRLVNVDDKENKEIIEKFEAFGSALFLHNTETGSFKNLTEFAFMNAGNTEKFHAGLKKEIQLF